MKKLLILLGLLICVWSCTNDYTVYDYTITYTIEGGSPITEQHRIELPSRFTPAYVLGNGSLTVIGSYGMSSGTYTTIYKGSLTVKVLNFEYKKVRDYKASGWDGHEIKTK